MADTRGYRLKSEMARVCLPAPQARVQRHLAWTNSICLLFLIIGLVGFRPSPPPPPRVKPLEPPTLAILELLPPPPTPADLKQEDQPKDTDHSAAPKFVMVTPDSPAINFSMPTIGNVLVPNTLAAVPSAVPLQRPVAVVKASPSLLTDTGNGGERPSPNEYPRIAQQLGQQGKVMLLLTVNESGVVTSAEVQETSGFPILDHFSVEWVKRHWTLPPGAAGRLFLAPFDYKLKSN
jgi:protein TonB